MKNFFAQRDAAVGVGLGQSDAEAVGPDDVVEGLLVVGDLAGELGEIDAGAKLGGVQVEFDRVENAFVFIEHVVARVAGQVGGDGGEAHVASASGTRP